MAADLAVIVAAAGKSERFGGKEKKIFAKLDGRPVFLRSLELFVTRPEVCQTILVVAPEDVDQVKTKFGPNLGFMGVKLVEGGARRADTVKNALAVLPEAAKLVAVHDAARPCASAHIIDAVIEEARKSGAAIPVSPVTATLKRVSSGNVVEETVSREGLYEAQTPQVFRRDVLEKAYEDSATADATDDCQLVERSGFAVTTVAGDASNLKITSPGDLSLAAAIIKTRPLRPVKKLGAFEEARW